MVIQHNLSAMNGNRQYNIVTRTVAKSTEKLSSGYQVNRAADDAAGLSISEKMRRQIRGLTQASYNAQDGISMVQIADGAMAEVHDMLQRGNELAIKAANGTLSPEDRSYLHSELEQIKEEIDAIQEKTTFNEMYVLKGDGYLSSGTTYTVGGLPDWVGIDPGSAASGVMSDTYTDASSNDHVATTVDFSEIATRGTSELIDQGFHFTCCTCDNHFSVNFQPGTGVSKSQSGHQYVYNVGVDGITTGEELVKRIISALDNGHPGQHFTMLTVDPSEPEKLILYDYRTSVAPDKANGRGLFAPGIVYESAGEPNRKSIFLLIGSEANNVMEIKLPYIDSESTGIKNATLLSPESARSAIGMFRTGIAFVSNERSRMGAYQNRLEHTIKNLNSTVENTTAAESRIRDTDMAKEMMRLANQNILAQAGQAILTQSNQSAQGVLSLLQ